MLALKFIPSKMNGKLQLLTLLVLLACAAQPLKADHTLRLVLVSHSTETSVGRTQVKDAHWELTDESKEGGFKGLNFTNGEAIKWVSSNAFSLVVSNFQDWTVIAGQPHQSPNHNEGRFDSSPDPGTGNMPVIALQFSPKHPKSSSSPLDINYVIVFAAGSGPTTKLGAMNSVYWFPNGTYEDMAVATMTWQ